MALAAAHTVSTVREMYWARRAFFMISVRRNASMRLGSKIVYAGASCDGLRNIFTGPSSRQGC